MNFKVFYGTVGDELDRAVAEPHSKALERLEPCRFLVVNYHEETALLWGSTTPSLCPFFPRSKTMHSLMFSIRGRS